MGDEFDEMADACIDAGHHVMRSGTPDLQSAMRVLLLILGQEIARREADDDFDDDLPPSSGQENPRN